VLKERRFWLRKWKLWKERFSQKNKVTNGKRNRVSCLRTRSKKQSKGRRSYRNKWTNSIRINSNSLTSWPNRLKRWQNYELTYSLLALSSLVTRSLPVLNRKIGNLFFLFFLHHITKQLNTCFFKMISEVHLVSMINT